MGSYDEDFQFGPLARGLYMAALAVGMGLGVLLPAVGAVYILALILLGMFARPLLLRTGLHHRLGALLRRPDDRRWHRYTTQRRREVERKTRDARYRGARKRDPRLPPNW